MPCEASVRFLAKFLREIFVARIGYSSRCCIASTPVHAETRLYASRVLCWFAGQDDLWLPNSVAALPSQEARSQLRTSGNGNPLARAVAADLQTSRARSILHLLQLGDA